MEQGLFAEVIPQDDIKFRFEIRDGNHSADVQRKVFSKGGGWTGLREKSQELHSFDRAYLFVELKSGILTMGSDRTDGWAHGYLYKGATIEDLDNVPDWHE